MSLAELLVIFLVAVCVFSPEQINQLAKKLGRFFAWFEKETHSSQNKFGQRLQLKQYQARAEAADKHYQSQAKNDPNEPLG